MAPDHALRIRTKNYGLDPDPSYTQRSGSEIFKPSGYLLIERNRIRLHIFSSTTEKERKSLVSNIVFRIRDILIRIRILG